MTAPLRGGSNSGLALILVSPPGITHALTGTSHWELLGLLLSGSLVGAVAGARVTLRCPERWLKIAIVVLVLLAAVATTLRAG
jgi:uncharacterized membrane protein YfcA